MSSLTEQPNNLSEQKNTVKSQSEITVFSFILQDAL